MQARVEERTRRLGEEKGLCRASLATEQDRRDSAGLHSQRNMTGGTLSGFASNGTGPEGLCWASFTTEHDRRDSVGLR